MKHRGWLVPLAIAALLAVGGCTGDSASVAQGEPPAVKEPADENGLSRITLSASAAERLGIEVGQVADAAAEGDTRKIMPYGALIYDPDGSTWAYTNPEGLVYVRAPLTVDRVEGDQVLLLDGPPSGTDVVRVGAAELYGIEYGIGK